MATFSLTAKTKGRRLCENEPEAFFARTAQEAAQAAEACGSCPHELGCRLEGLLRDEAGVWGGLSRNHRQRMGVEGRQQEIWRLQNLLGQKRRLS
jgi:hypothetical protein